MLSIGPLLYFSSAPAQLRV